MRRSFTTALLMVLILFSKGVFSTDKALWVSAEGSFQGSEIMGRKYICEKALEYARKKAIEKVSGVYIESRALVAQGRLLRDVIHELAKGKIKKEKILDENFDGNTLICTVKAKFLVEPQEIKLSDYRLNIKLPKKSFKAGEKVKIFLETGSSCYPYLFSVDVSKNVYRIYPVLKEDYGKRIKGILELPTEKMKELGIFIRHMVLMKSHIPRQRSLCFSAHKKGTLLLKGCLLL